MAHAQGLADRVAVDRGLVIRMLVTLGLLAAIYAAFVALVVAAGEGSVALLVIALTVTAVLVLLGPRAALRALGVRLLPPSERPELHERLRRLAMLMGMPTPRLGFIDCPMPNAFAIGYAMTSRGVSRSVIVVTSRLLELLEPEELDAVLAHELAHLRNRDALVLSLSSALAVAALVAAVIMAWVAVGSGKLAQLTARLTTWLLPSPSSGQRVGCLRGCFGLNAAMSTLAFGTFALGALLMAGFYAIMHASSLLAVLALSRYREFVADRAAALLTGKPACLASALLKLGTVITELSSSQRQRLGTFRAFMLVDSKDESGFGLLSTHPPLAERVRRLMEIEKLLNSMSG